MTERVTSHELKPMSTREAIDWYLEARKPEIRPETYRTIESALAIFRDWANEFGLENLNDLDGRALRRFRTWRKTRKDIELITLNSNLAILRRFLRFAEAVEAIPPGLAEKTPMPNVPPADEVDGFVPSDEQVAAIRAYLETFEPNSRVHLEHALIRSVGLRMGAVRAVDLGDYDSDRREITLKHRPEDGHEKGTPLKNGHDGQRLINIPDSVGDYLDTYIVGRREAVDDVFGREPLFTTDHGRVTLSTIRRDFYKVSRPCVSANECPHDRAIDDCRATHSEHASKCPSSYSSHPLRRWSIMNQLDSGVPIDKLSNRVDVSVPVLEQHYDLRSETRKGRSRRDVLRQHLDGY